MTLFRDVKASTANRRPLSLRHIAEGIRTFKRVEEKDEQPLLKLAGFEDKRTDKGSLRHDANMFAIDGVEGDYDAGEVGIEEAAEMLRRAGLAAVLYTSSSHTPEAPRWRVLAPCSDTLPTSERKRLLNRLNGALGNILGQESFTASQAFYYGWARIRREKVPLDQKRRGVVGAVLDDDCPAPMVFEVDGAFLDQANHLSDKDTRKKTPEKGTAANTDDASANIDWQALSEDLGERLRKALQSRKDLRTALTKKAEKTEHGRSAIVFAIGGALCRAGFSVDDYMAVVWVHAETKSWAEETGSQRDNREFQNIWGKVLSEKDTDNAGTPFTEDSLALEFVRQHKDRVRYCHGHQGWFLWTGTHWKQDGTRQAFSWMRELCRKEAFGQEKEAAKVALSKVATSAAVERFASGDQEVAMTMDDWDRDPFLLGTPGGVVDLRTGKLRPATQEDYISKQVAVAPSEKADCPFWLAFLEEATGGDMEVVAYLQRWAGYCLTGSTEEQSLMFLFGPGGNGKGVFANTLQALLGDYSRAPEMDMFEARDFSQHPTGMAMLHGARMVVASETEEGSTWASKKIKQLTGGDPVTAHFMRKDNFTYLPQFKLMFLGNHKPAFRNVDDAIRRRFKLVPFVNKPVNKDPKLPETLKEKEWPGILRWAIEGALAWQKDGLREPEIVEATSQRYFEDEDFRAHWFDECCELSPKFFHSQRDLFSSLRQYAKDNERDPGTQKELMAWLEYNKPVIEAKSGNDRGWRGVRLRGWQTKKERAAIKEPDGDLLSGYGHPHGPGAETPPQEPGDR